MPTPATRIDPLANFLQQLADERALVPIPLIATRIDISVHGGLATVTTERTFRNSEKHSIEATMTFPLPVDATLCALTARIGDRTLTAIAEISDKARDDYEEAVHDGKAAVLHEEPLKGIHVLSVAHVAPGTQIVVGNTWTAPLSFVGAKPRLRIPTTVGDIYGIAPLSPDDALIVGEAVQKASVGITCRSGTASLEGVDASPDGRFTVTLNRPLDIVVDGWKEETLEGRAADGRKVTLQIKPAAKGDRNLDIAVLFDHSGSMDEQAVGDGGPPRSKFDVAKAALLAISKKRLAPADRLHLWQFNDQVDFVGTANGAAAHAVVERLRSPSGGTEIGQALDTAITSGETKDLIVVTDGKSWAFDPQTLAGYGIRLTAVLIGEDALEAGIAHLASITGGQVFVAAGADAATAIAAALDAARLPHEPPVPIRGNLVRVNVLRRGARIAAAWGGLAKGQVSDAARQVGATASALAIPLLDKRAAAALAKKEGIVTHLTSLVLIDDEGERSNAIPARRKVPLQRPLAAAPHTPMRAMASASRACMVARPAAAASIRRYGSSILDNFNARPVAASAAPVVPAGPGELDGVVIDWDADPDALRRGDLTQLDLDTVDAIRRAAQSAAVAALARTLSLDPVIVVIALIAQATTQSRSAQRLARAILGTTPDAELADARSELHL